MKFMPKALSCVCQILFCKAANKGYSSTKGKFRSDKLSTAAVVSQPTSSVNYWDSKSDRIVCYFADLLH
ncbi:hypothetical protein T4D_15270 [Trichinella pseudospiralis]|uniref:Uncharacterized protein n=1 Tax=Trichinella pseudospiralis TaxID=6337 RepID=A0A0V1F532_TRIPS|nr:hypothetical protein T4D_15243 [Trichinella pseudospiralis]KRY81115.1 hypothetical protein T4D_6885 [Trichinella pseudospiralis]KRY87293.1 hypothetical protein T4D_15270 [Trichinella pseudospiralis]